MISAFAMVEGLGGWLFARAVDWWFGGMIVRGWWLVGVVFGWAVSWGSVGGF